MKLLSYAPDAARDYRYLGRQLGSKIIEAGNEQAVSLWRSWLGLLLYLLLSFRPKIQTITNFGNQHSM